MLRAYLVASLSLLLVAQSVLAEELIHWHEDLAQARQISQQYRVPMLIHFYGDQCMPCKTLEQNVFTRPEVASTMQRYFVPVRINATRDRRTAAEYGVHSWPQDVFVAPDGKTLMQGVCNQNPNNYLQNLQNIALMNRDRNALLAGNAPAAPAAPAGAQAFATQGPPGQPVSTPVAAAPAPEGSYGRLAAQSLQQAAPGRDNHAPSPYSNPSSGPNPYPVPHALANSNMAAGGAASNLPSPTWQGQSANGQAQSGLVNAGPLPSSAGMTSGPAQAGPTADGKLPNLPPHSSWSPESARLALGPSAAQQSAAPNLPSAPTLPAAATTSEPTTARNNPNGYTNGRSVVGRDAIVSNPHYAVSNPSSPTVPSQSASNQSAMATATPMSTASPQPQWAAPESTKSGPPSQLVSTSNNVVASSGIDRHLAPAIPASSNSPALDGYCPVALFQDDSQWIKGSDKFAIRHRGRIYYLSSEEAAQKFLAAPDSFTPVLSGHDPLVFVREGRLVEGSIYDGVLKDKQYIHLFSSQENKQYFYDNYDQLIRQLESIVRQRQ